MSDTTRYPFAVFCVRAYKRDDAPLTRHRKVERAVAAATSCTKQFRTVPGNRSALLSFEVYELLDGEWRRSDTVN